MPITTLRSELERRDHLRSRLVVALGKILLEPALLARRKLRRVGASRQDLAAVGRVGYVFFEMHLGGLHVGFAGLGVGSLVSGVRGSGRRSGAGRETDESEQTDFDERFHFDFLPGLLWFSKIHGRASSTRLNGVSVARRRRAKPPP